MIPTKTCSSCKYWGKPYEYLEIGIDARFCQHKMVCQPEYGTRGNRTMTNSGVYTCDEGGLTGELITGPDFGCIHYEAKEEQ